MKKIVLNIPDNMVEIELSPTIIDDKGYLLIAEYEADTEVYNEFTFDSNSLEWRPNDNSRAN